MGDAAVVVFGVLGVDVETSLSQLFLSSPMVLNPVVFWLPSPCFVPSHLNTIIKGQSTNEKNKVDTTNRCEALKYYIYMILFQCITMDNR